jgi:hypothetical protein
VVGARVKLKNDLTTDGMVESSAGKAKWTVRWDEGPVKGTVVAQSSKSLRLWRVDLSAFDAGEAGGSDSSEEEGAEEPAPEVDHPERKRKFEVYAKTLEGKTVKVRPFKRVLALRTSGLTMISPPHFYFYFSTGRGQGPRHGDMDLP